MFLDASPRQSLISFWPPSQVGKCPRDPCPKSTRRVEVGDLRSWTFGRTSHPQIVGESSEKAFRRTHPRGREREKIEIVIASEKHARRQGQSTSKLASSGCYCADECKTHEALDVAVPPRLTACATVLRTQARTRRLDYQPVGFSPNDH